MQKHPANKRDAFLFCRGQHLFDKDAVAGGGVGDENVGDRADDLAVLQDGATAHECVNIGPTNHFSL